MDYYYGLFLLILYAMVLMLGCRAFKSRAQHETILKRFSHCRCCGCATSNAMMKGSVEWSCVCGAVELGVLTRRRAAVMVVGPQAWSAGFGRRCPLTTTT